MAGNCVDWTQKQAILEQFRDITLVENAVAEQYLDACGWDIDTALNMYLSSNPEESMGTTENPIEIPDSPEKLPPGTSLGQTPSTPIGTSLGQTPSDNQINPNSKFKLLSWNIDGLDENQIRERTRYVISLIKTKQPDAVYLQEVIEETFQFFTRQLPEYMVLCAETQVSYFNAMMLRRATTKPLKELQWQHFTTSRMGRHLLIQPVLFCDKIKLVLMTSHLESTKDCAQERKKQLKEVYSKMTSQGQEYFVIFGGDTNARDKEVEDVGLPWRVADMWEACGSDKSTRYTWDTSVNDNLNMNWKSKLRFDRIYFHSDSHISLNPTSFMLVGQERLASGCFPSDHWGIWCEFKQTKL